MYLGRAGTGKNAKLKPRLTEELRDEQVTFWASVFGREVGLRQYNERRGMRKYRTPTRSLRKMGAQFVIWISADSNITEDEISRQEKILIYRYRPTHNAMRGERIEGDELTDAIEDQMQLEKIRHPGC